MSFQIRFFLIHGFQILKLPVYSELVIKVGGQSKTCNENAFQNIDWHIFYQLMKL